MTDHSKPQNIRITQGQPTNDLLKANKREYTYMTTDKITGTKSFHCGQNTTATISDQISEQNPRFTGTTKVLFVFLLNRLEENGLTSNQIDFTLSEYMEARGLKDRTSAKETLLKDLEILYHLSLHWTGPCLLEDPETGKKKRSPANASWDMRICSAKGQAGRNFFFGFGPEFMAWRKGAGFMDIPRAVTSADPRRNPNALPFSIALLQHMYTNRGKPNQNLISVKSLLKNSDSIPDREELKNEWNDRHYDRKILEPMIRDLDWLETHAGLKWQFCNKCGAPLTDDQLRDIDKLSTIENCRIQFSFDSVEPPKRKTRGRGKRTAKTAPAQSA